MNESNSLTGFIQATLYDGRVIWLQISNIASVAEKLDQPEFTHVTTSGGIEFDLNIPLSETLDLLEGL